MTVQTMPAPTALACPRDETVTRLTCSRCGTPICPACLIRTAVGMRCPGCAVRTPARRSSPTHGRLVRVAAAVAAVAAVAGGLSLRGRDSRPAEGEVVEAVAGTPAAALGREVTVGRFAVTVTAFRCTGEPAGPAPAAPAKRCVADLSIRNDGLQTGDFPVFQMVADGVRRFAPSATGDAQAPLLPPAAARRQPPVVVNPGVVVETVLVFKVPETFEPSRLELRDSPRAPAVRVALPA